ncbi:hypothetical protein AK812_SmicGene19970 [Symbiodinium microadriaticum]|uniref:Uncharacterized protein n=1 Tax=Symbiodinium microadriaticum TaxID=2951 RepID=A0A1Q9DR70_SYMMI|nr:hypothetical protein AK812_SmicGene19970 [Symbiodinium microadriaticum]
MNPHLQTGGEPADVSLVCPASFGRTSAVPFVSASESLLEVHAGVLLCREQSGETSCPEELSCGGEGLGRCEWECKLGDVCGEGLDRCGWECKLGDVCGERLGRCGWECKLGDVCGEGLGRCAWECKLGDVCGERLGQCGWECKLGDVSGEGVHRRPSGLSQLLNLGSPEGGGQGGCMERGAGEGAMGFNGSGAVDWAVLVSPALPPGDLANPGGAKQVHSMASMVALLSLSEGCTLHTLSKANLVADVARAPHAAGCAEPKQSQAGCLVHGWFRPAEEEASAQRLEEVWARVHVLCCLVEQLDFELARIRWTAWASHKVADPVAWVMAAARARVVA